MKTKEQIKEELFIALWNKVKLVYTGEAVSMKHVILADDIDEIIFEIMEIIDLTGSGDEK